MLFEGEACAKGTAMVAKARMSKARDPRPCSASGGGSSGGRACVTSFSSMSGGSARNPRSGAEIVEMFSARSRAEQDVKVVKTAEAEQAGNGDPARTERSFFVRTLRAIGNVEGDRNPMRGGSTHWVACAAIRTRWMSTGRPRAEC